MHQEIYASILLCFVPFNVTFPASSSHKKKNYTHVLKDTCGQHSAMKWKRLILPHRILFSQLASTSSCGTKTQPVWNWTTAFYTVQCNTIFCEEFSTWNTVEEHQEVEQDDYTSSPTTCPYAECCQKDDTSTKQVANARGERVSQESGGSAKLSAVDFQCTAFIFKCSLNGVS